MTSSSNVNAWIQLYIPKKTTKFRLFCFPYAGGGAVTFHAWRDQFPPEVEVCAVELPGRGKRFTEEPFTSLPPLIDALAQGIEPYLTLPFAFFGHSMGGLVSFELARYLRKKQIASPMHLFISAFRAPQLPDPDPPIHQLPDVEFIKELKQLNGTPQAVLENTELMQVLFHTLRADFSVCETYVYEEEAPLPCHLSVFGGVYDNEVSRAELEQWQKQTRSDFSLRMFPGDHFFLLPMQRPLLRAISQDLMPYLK